MYHAFYSKAQELLAQNMPFATALVVRAEKPTSGKPGDKALITADGTLYGWIGGSCSQPTVVREALKALKDGRSRFIRLSPDPESLVPRDGLIDHPMTCFSGGTLEIFIEPQYPQPRLMVIGTLPVARALVALGKVMNYEVVAVDPDGGGQPLVEAHHTLSKLDEIVGYIHPETYIVVATHGSADEAALEVVLKAKPRYVGLVASQKRFQSVLDYLRGQGVAQADLDRIKAPAGLNILAQQGDEIALSIFAEIVQVRRGVQEEADWGTAPVEPADPSLPNVMLHEAPTGIAIDPVCHMEVDIATAKYVYEYEGITYYFCAPGCKMSFSKNPQQYLSSQGAHPHPHTH
jgi:xanthine dehydrogenase accessory factor